MERVLVSAPAKVNLALRVGSVRPDGFHELDTVFEALDIFDDIEVRPGAELTLVIPGTDLPTDERNLAIKAARALQAHTGTSAGAHIEITKRIPIAGGMAGGSADAAGTLVALNELWQLHLDTSELIEIGARLGSDVPFALHGSIAHATGRGELLRALPVNQMHTWVIITRPEGLSTPAVFAEYDRLAPASSHRPADTVALQGALASGTLEDVGGLLANDLTAAATSLRPELGELLNDLTARGYHAILSGSGPSIAVLTQPVQAQELAASLGERVVVASGPAAGAHVRLAS